MSGAAEAGEGIARRSAKSWDRKSMSSDGVAGWPAGGEGGGGAPTKVGVARVGVGSAGAARVGVVWEGRCCTQGGETTEGGWTGTVDLGGKNGEGRSNVGGRGVVDPGADGGSGGAGLRRMQSATPRAFVMLIRLQAAVRARERSRRVEW